LGWLSACSSPFRSRRRKRSSTRGIAGGYKSQRYTALDQINKKNVAQIQVAWTYPVGDMRTYRFNPIVVDNVMYTLAKNMALVALDAATGKEIWTHENQGAIGDRGINYWESADRKDRRLLFINAGFLTAVDASTGNAIETFGDKGRAILRVDPSRDLGKFNPLQTGNPGRVFENLIILSLPPRARRIPPTRPTRTPTTCAPENSCGRSTACRRRASSAPTRGPRRRSRAAAASTTGAS
jgi:quinoprotein glucose dehydrogenase